MATETDIANRALSRLGDKRITLLGTDTTKHALSADDAYLIVRDEVIRAYPWNCLMKRAETVVAKTITAATAADPVVVTVAAHGWVNGDQIYIDGAGGMTEINALEFLINNVTTNTFELQDSTGTDVDGASGPYGTYTSGGTANLRPLFGYDQAITLPADCKRVVEVYDSRLPWVVEDNMLLSDEESTLRFRYIAHNAARAATDPVDHNYDAMLISALAARLAVELCEELTQSTSKKQAMMEAYMAILTQARGVDAQEQSPQQFQEDDWILARQGSNFGVRNPGNVRY
jgi:hypothetical protein